MSNRWQSHRIAADYEGEAPEYEPEAAVAAADTETLTVGGFAIGASCGGQDDDEIALRLLGEGYLKSFASATPDGRAGGYDGADLEVDEREERRRQERERWGGISAEGAMRHYVAKDARGRSSSGRKREAKAVSPNPDANRSGNVEPPVGAYRVQIRGLTLGEVEFWSQNPGVAEEKLTTLYKQLQLTNSVPAPMQTRHLRKADRVLTLYLLPEVSFGLSRFAGAIHALLVDHAHAKGHERIMLRDELIELRCKTCEALVVFDLSGRPPKRPRRREAVSIETPQSQAVKAALETALAVAA